MDKGKTPEQLYAERSKRVDDAIHLRQPDRIPISLSFNNMLANLAGMTQQEIYEDAEKANAALELAARRYQPDLLRGVGRGPGPSLALGDRSTKWPGHGLDANSSFQYVETEYMKAEDYDAFLADPTDWGVRTYLPRVFGELEGLSQLPHLGLTLFGFWGMSMYIGDFASPPVVSALEALCKAGKEQVEWRKRQKETSRRMAALGFPPTPYKTGGSMAAPFDFMGDTLRGMKGLFLDMRRRPEQLLEAEEKVGRMQTENAIARCRATGANSVNIPLHRGSDGFISIPMFERFYWPQFKKMVFDLTDAGIMPHILWEGNWDQRLHYLTELPKGKTIGWFQQSNIFKVKEMLGDTMCIIGGMPISMLLDTPPEEIREYTKKVCQQVGKGGGFIMSTDIGDMEGANPDLVQVWVEAAREFGVY